MSLSVRGRLMTMGATGLALMLAVGGAGYLGLVRSDRAMRDAAVTAEGLRNHLESDMMHDALRGDVYGAMLARTDDEKTQVRADLKEHADHFREMVEANRKLPLGAETAAALASVEPKLEAYIGSAEKLVDAALADPSAAEPMMPDFNATFSDLETEMERLSDIVQKAQQAAAEETTVTVSRSEFQMIGIAAFAFAVMSLLLWFVQRSIIRPLNECVRVLGFVSEGDLTQRTNVPGNDELASLARSTNNAADTMEQLVSEIVSASTKVANTSTDIVASANDTAEGMGRQLDQVRQIAAAVEEMTASVAEVARQSGEATKTSAESGRVASEGGQTVNATIQDMQSINEAVSAGAASVAELGKRSEEIGRIIGVINDIADQTNLLALNAAIEAARAGEHGRGFAVVADEVRKLADRTTKATDEIAQSIRAIQSETGEAVRRMEGGTEQVRAGVERAMSAGASLSQIVAGAGEVARMIQSIAAAADEQSAASEEISRSIAAISLTAEGAKHAVQAAGQLSEQAETLRTLTTRFKLSRNP